MDTKLLQEIGLTNSEITVYTTLLKTSSIKVGDLMKQISLHRSRVYEAINRLSDKGLVSYVIKNNIKYFEASDPERLLSYIEEQKEKLNQKESKIKKIIPELKKQVPTYIPHAEAHVFAGKEGFKTIRKDVLKQKQDLYLIGAVGKEDKFLNIYADRVVNVLWKGDTPTCFMIINKDIANSYRKWFDLLWKSAKK